MSKPTKKALIARIEDIIAGCYGAPWEPSTYSEIVHMGGIAEFEKLVAAVNNVFPLTCPDQQKGAHWGTPTMPWNLDQWENPATLADLLLRYWQEGGKNE